MFCIVFRTGGTKNFKWHTSLGMSEVEANEAFLVVNKMGYTCYIADLKQVLAIGVPDTYSVE